MRPIARQLAGVLAAVFAAGFSACAVGPDYRRPEVEMPPDWSPASPSASESAGHAASPTAGESAGQAAGISDTLWRAASPNDAALKGDWWTVFDDPLLDPLVGRTLASNQNLRVAAARFEQAQAQYAMARADLFPTVNLLGSVSRGADSANRPLAAYSVSNQSTVQNDFKVGPAVSYEVDLFGRVRREVEGAKASAQQAEADLQNTRLVIIASLVSDYFSLRELDIEIEVVRQSLQLEQGALDFIVARHDLGYATGLDLDQQQALLQSSAAQLELLQNQRVQVEHAIATIVGTPAPSFSLSQSTMTPPLPRFGFGVPSDLLQRRPDVAAAERAMAAANARIGVAKAAYFPIIELTPGIGLPGIGWESNALASLVEAPSRFWSTGLSASQLVFDAGRTRANVRYASADYQAAVAGYRQTVLTALEEVQNGITGIAVLARAKEQADASVVSAQRAYDIASERYKGGVATYLDVITAQQALLNNRRQAAQILGQQFALAVYLVKALGGGWSDAPASAAAVRTTQ